MIVDSNVIIDLLHGTGSRADLVFACYVRLRAMGSAVINPVIFAESASGSPSLESFEARLVELRIGVEPLSNADAFRASHAFRQYRRNGGPRTTILPDFLIGAQAAVRSWPILTRDPERFASYFPEVELIDPLKACHD
jgi:predicted nucleic acid-binding protein